MDNGQQMNSQVSPNLSREDCYKAAQGESLPDIGVVCNTDIKELITKHALAIGCQEDYIFLPLLSTCAALMGTGTKIKFNQTWMEPPILWTLIGAQSGTRKTAALKQIMTPLLSIVKDQNRHWQMTHASSAGDSMAPRTKIINGTTCTSLQELEQTITKNTGQIFCIAENIEHFHKTLGISDNQSKEKIHYLYDGLACFNVRDGEISTVENTCFNITGFARPEFIVDLQLSKPAWLGSKYLISCAQRSSFATDLYPSSLPEGMPSLKTLFQTLQTYHQQPREYVFSDAARKEMNRCHEHEWIKMMSQLNYDRSRRAVIEKSLGQIIRVAGVLKALFNAFQFTKHSSGSYMVSQGFQWDLTIDRDTLCRAIELVKYFVDQKLSLMMMTGFNFRHSLYTTGHIAMNVKESLRQYHNHQRQEQHQEQQKQIVRHRHQHHVQVAVQQTDLPMENNSALGRTEVYIDQSYGEGSEGQDGEIQTAEFVHMDKNTFLSVHGNRIRRLLECYDDGTGVSATTASQKSITPSVKLQSSNNRHPVWASALFFQKCQELGFGSAEQVKHPTNRKFYWRFKRKHISSLDENMQQLLNYLRVDMSLYSRANQQFTHPSPQFSPNQLPSDIAESLNDSNSLGHSVQDVSDDQDVEIIIKDEPM